MTELRPKVLLVDDVEANLVALEGILGRIPCDLVRAGSGNEALRLLLKEEFAVMLLDVQMPDMDGYEVAQHARDNPETRHVPVIFVTATHATEESILRGYDTGAFDLLFKPIDPYILRSKVQVFLDLYLGRRRLQAEIAAHKQTLAEVEAFNYSVSHDLRAPLRPLDGFSEALLEDYGDKLDDRGRNYLTRIRTAAQRMGQLIDDLLELSRVSRADLRRQQLDLSGLVGAIVADIRADPAAGEREVICTPDLQVRADTRLLRIALENLLRNAWKFTARQAQPKIEFRCTAVGEELIYSVRDNGVGFDPTYASKLFQPFQRLHTAEFAGTGIGLAIVDRIIRRHEGRIWGESAPDQGATFFFTLSAHLSSVRLSDVAAPPRRLTPIVDRTIEGRSQVAHGAVAYLTLEHPPLWTFRATRILNRHGSLYRDAISPHHLAEFPLFKGEFTRRAHFRNPRSSSPSRNCNRTTYPSVR